MSTVVEQIKDRLPITDILASYVTLIPSGNQYKARCPFHQEKTASFYVSPERKSYYCFGCGAKGDIFSFVEQFEGLDFKGALRLLAGRAGVVLTNQSFSQKNDDDALYDILEKAATLYSDALSKSTVAKQYLATRGITEKSIEEFRIGWAPDEWQFLTNTLLPEELLVAQTAGLVGKAEKSGTTRFYDRFRGRIMFPLCDSSGRIIAFSGRLFANTVDAPKYVNSPETPIFHKSKVLYGFHLAKERIRKNNFAILVEGQFDLVLSHQFGFGNTIATSGTALSVDATQDNYSNLSVLSRLTSNIFLAFDGDDAGQKAMVRAASVALSLGMQPKSVLLPEGEDPASYLTTVGAASWKILLKEGIHVIEAETIRLKRKGLSMHALVRELHESVFRLLVKVPSAIEQESLLRRIGEIVGIQEHSVIEDFTKYKKSLQSLTPPEVTIQKKISWTTYEYFVALLSVMDEADATAYQEKLASIAFDGSVFSAPAIPEEKMNALRFWAEQTFHEKDMVHKQKAADEYIARLSIEFYQTLRDSFTEQFQTINDDDTIRTAINRLSILIQEVKERARGT